MNLNPIKANMTELRLALGTVLFSYQTPVAYIDSNNNMYRTEKKWSNTTTKHINSWLGPKNGFPKPQEFFDNLIREVK